MGPANHPLPSDNPAAGPGGDLFHKAFVHSPVAMALVSIQGDFIRVNRALGEFLGYAEEELVRTTFRAMTHPEDLALGDELVRDTLAGKHDHFHLKKRYIRKDGSIVWGSLYAALIRHPDGTPAHLISQIQDITAEHLNAEKLQTEHNLLRTLLDHLPDRVYVRDRDSRYVLNNRAALAALRAGSLEETVGKTDFDFFPPEMAQAYFNDDQQVIATGEPLLNREEPCFGPDGEPRWQLTTKVPLRDAAGNVVGLVGIGRDITERRRILDQLRSQSAMLEQAHDAIILYDNEGRISYWNFGAQQLLGWTAAEVRGRSPKDFYLPEDLPAIEAAIQATQIKGGWRGELQVHAKNGELLTMETRRTLLRDAHGAPTGQLSINTDITERKKLEAQFLRAQRMESIGILAGGIAHDLNNILAPILMSIALLKLKVPDNPSVQKQLDQLAGNAQRGANLVKQVLAFGRGVEGQQVLMQPKHIAREIEQIVADTFPKNVKFELECGNDVSTVTGDPTQLHQVMLNLCVNARDAMPNGGRLSLKLENAVIDEVYAEMAQNAKAGTYVRLEVADTGTGIPAAIRDKIFEPFFTTKAVGHGTGLGLSTTLAIVKSHNGFIRVYSEDGKGTVFKVYLPATNAAAPFANEEAANRLPRGHNELILVVDDEELIREIARNALERFGYRVLLAKNGTEAVAHYAIHRNDVAVVITDMAMPIMDGAATILALRTINPDVNIIASSGLTMSGKKSNRGRPIPEGVRDFITKPYTAETLLNSLARVLGRES